jgi:Transposase DNA-binding/Transposase Tn5 dimerisation domain
MTAPNPLQFASSELWASHVAGQANFPDERLNARFGLVLGVLADRPLDAFPQATGSPGQAKALYRLLANQRLDCADFLQPLADTTVDACAGLHTVLAIQDTSAINYAALEKTKGLGKINDTAALGLHLHTTLAVDTAGGLRGLVHQTCWSRCPAAAPKHGNHKRRPIDDKESYKWLEGIDAAEAAFDALPAAQRPRLVHIFDREGDIHEVLQRIHGPWHGGIIRAAQNRSVAGDVNHAFDAIAGAPLLGTQVIDVPAKPGVKQRKAKLELRALPLTITPCAQYPQRQPVTWTLVEARETTPPAGVPALHWLLWTTEPAGTVAQIRDVLRCYKLRWLIEDFHLTLKSGCRIEALRLRSAERLRKAITLYSGVATRIVALRDLARRHPHAPCDSLLTTDQWHALYCYFKGQRPPAAMQPLSIRQAVLWIGRLGGHLNRKGDGMPGVRTLWRGWRDLTILVAGYCAGKTSA